MHSCLVRTLQKLSSKPISMKSKSHSQWPTRRISVTPEQTWFRITTHHSGLLPPRSPMISQKSQTLYRAPPNTRLCEPGSPVIRSRHKRDRRPPVHLSLPPFREVIMNADAVTHREGSQRWGGNAHRTLIGQGIIVRAFLQCRGLAMPWNTSTVPLPTLSRKKLRGSGSVGPGLEEGTELVSGLAYMA